MRIREKRKRGENQFFEGGMRDQKQRGFCCSRKKHLLKSHLRIEIVKLVCMTGADHVPARVHLSKVGDRMQAKGRVDRPNHDLHYQRKRKQSENQLKRPEFSLTVVGSFCGVTVH